MFHLRHLDNYIDDYGTIRDDTDLVELEWYIEFNVVEEFRRRGYGNYPFNNESLERMFRIVKVLAKNCRP